LLVQIEAQNAELARINKAAAASKSVRSTKTTGSKSHGQASSPHPDRRREKDANAQQMTVYDPVLAGKQQAGHICGGFWGYNFHLEFLCVHWYVGAICQVWGASGIYFCA
jgi:hypothetical protein